MAADLTYTLNPERLTQPVIDTWQRLQRLGLSAAQIHEALQPMIALVDHYKRQVDEEPVSRPVPQAAVVVRRQRAAS